jgi:hypothetical protein
MPDFVRVPTTGAFGEVAACGDFGSLEIARTIDLAVNDSRRVHRSRRDARIERDASVGRTHAVRSLRPK